MKMTSLVSIITLVLGLTVLVYLRKPTKGLEIGIVQTASHPALDAAREGFIQQLEENLGQKIHWSVQNAEGSMSQLASIAKSYQNNENIKVIYAIGTQAVQMTNKMAPQKQMIYAAVTAPEDLKLGPLACGTSDRVDVKAQAKLIKETFPQVEKIAILLNPAEHNSTIQVKAMEEALKERGLLTLRIGVHNQTDILSAAASAARQADLILVPTDNLLVSSMPLLAKAAIKYKIPLVVSDTPSVNRGAMMAKGVSYKDCGKISANIAKKLILNQKSPEEIGTVHPENNLVLINTDTLEKLGLELPESLLNKSTLVTRKKG